MFGEYSYLGLGDLHFDRVFFFVLAKASYWQRVDRPPRTRGRQKVRGVPLLSIMRETILREAGSTRTVERGARGLNLGQRKPETFWRNGAG